MVMATPSPQQVGREFVRQYYTVLHEAPEILHRFYNSGSTFVHGGVDRPGVHAEEPVTGQLDIDRKIKELNFKDCHTKIRQVDSQATIGSGVVVQVTGELSNNGEPMRRFMQTFVLAPQSAKKYYVHNDIFRYQDEVYQDNSDSESEDHQEPAHVKPTHNNYYQTNDQVSDADVDAAHLNHHHHEQVHVEQPAKIQDEVKSENLLNGHATAPAVETVAPQQQPQPQRVVPGKEELKENKNVDLFTIENHDVTKTATTTSAAKEESAKQDSQSKDSKSSWAKIISSKDANVTPATQTFPNHSSSSVNQTSTGGSTMKFGSGPNVKDGKKPAQNGPSSSGKSAKTAPAANATKPAAQPSQTQAQPAAQQPSQAAPQAAQPPRNAQTDANSINNLDDGRTGRYPDTQQVFVGNLNQELSETELKQFFGQYGKVIEVRINTNSKQPSGRRLPNYGFVVFDDKQTVDNLLGQTKSNNLIFKNDKGVEYRLNVEEKRARQGRQSGFGNGGGGGKGNRTTRSTSNGSRNGPSTNGNSSSGKKNSTNNHNNSNSDTNTFISEKKKEIHESHAIMEGGGGHKNISRRS